jgi:polysaccharide pyruvyl transferase WcaK-like protein
LATRPLRIALWGNFGTGNLGNECTLQAIIHNSHRFLPDAELTCICSEPPDTALRHGVHALPISHLRQQGAGQSPSSGQPRALRRALRLAGEIRSWSRAFATMARMDRLVMAGTGMLTDSGEGALGLPYEIFKWSVAARALGKRLLFASVGVESIQHPLARLFIRISLRLAHYRCYRDRQSRDLLEGIGFAAGQDPVYPDLAFSLPEFAAPVGGRGGPRPLVAVGVYDYCGGGETTAYRVYLDKLCSFVLWLLERDYRVRIVVGDLSYDASVRSHLRGAIAARGVTPRSDGLLDEPASSVEQLVEQLAGTDVVVATRFHNVVLALILGKPVLSISYNQKNDALMDQMGLAGYCQPIGQLDVDLLIRQFQDLEGNAARLRPVVLEKTRQNRALLEEEYAVIFSRA